MAKQIQLRRGTTAENNGFTGAVGEVSVDTDKEVLVVHDGVTAGGFPVAARANANGTISLIKKDGVVLDTLTPSTNLVGYAPIAWAQSTPPSGYVQMVGQTLGLEYPILRSIYGNNLPDLRGVFVRGWDSGRGLDSGRELLSYQVDDLASHKHTLLRATNSGVGSLTDQVTTANGDGGLANAVGNTGGGETRPKNIAFNYIVKLG
jgi:microcystin-dependent protein